VQKPLAVVVVAGMMLAPVVILLTLPALISMFSRRSRRGLAAEGHLASAE
jgi:cobalt-zinc-cadmium resistance protein CzcA